MDTIFHYYYTVPKRDRDSDEEDAPAPIRDIKKGPMSEGKKSVGFGDSKIDDKKSQKSVGFSDSKPSYQTKNIQIDNVKIPETAAVIEQVDLGNDKLNKPLEQIMLGRNKIIERHKHASPDEKESRKSTKYSRRRSRAITAT